jgi:Helix-turn-helix domain
MHDYTHLLGHHVNRGLLVHGCTACGSAWALPNTGLDDPALADELAAVGCEDERLLEHLRGRGCESDGGRLGRMEAMLRELVGAKGKAGRDDETPPLGQEGLSIKETAAVYGLSEDTVRRDVVCGELPAANLGTSGRPRYVILRKDVEALLERRKSEPAPARRKKKAAPPPPSRHFKR